MAVDVLMGALVPARGIRRLHTARPAAHRREFYVRFVGTCLSHRYRHRGSVIKRKCSLSSHMQIQMFVYSRLCCNLVISH